MAELDIQTLTKGLNDDQARAVTTLEGPLLIVAGPGSGKTRVLTHRIGALLAAGVAPWRILAVTFTNKAAAEMRSRIDILVGEVSRDLWVSTFHSLCVKLLRRYGGSVGLEPNFTILDQDDSLKMVKASVVACGGMPEDAKRMQKLISFARNNMVEPENIDDAPARIGAIAQEYERRKRAAGVVDFDDLLTLMHRLLGQESVARELRAKFGYVLVDEYQDTNRVQYEILRALTADSHNLCVVGDSDQCLLPGSMISAASGKTAIEDIHEGDAVLSTRGHLNTTAALVRTSKRGEYEGAVVRVSAGGNILIGTPHHLVPARFEGASGEYYVYLMWRADRGYRIGRTKSIRANGHGSTDIGFVVRMNQEHGDKLWVLRMCASMAEAGDYASYYAAAYGLGTSCFHTQEREGFAMREEDLVRLSSELGTDTPAKRLMDDLLLHQEFPHFTSQSGVRCQAVLLTMFADTRGLNSYHRVSWTSTNQSRMDAARAAGFSVRPAKNGARGVRMETSRKDYRDALQLAQGLGTVVGAEVHRRMLIGGRSYPLMPISHLHQGMRVLVANGSEIVDVPVESVSREQYSGPVYDLEVAGAHNYVANGIVVHNSVYAFRGAFPGVLDGFLKDYPEAQTIKLGQNYRSTKRVLAVAGAIISPNPTAARAELWTENEHGETVRMVAVGDDRDEAAWVVADLKRQTGTTAIIVRMNAQTKPFEDGLMSSRTPFQLVGAQRFFDRAEVRDTMSWLRAALNPGDYLALSRAAGSPKRGLGEKTLADWFAKANERGITPIALAEDPEALSELGTRGIKVVYDFARDVASVSQAAQQGPEAALKQVVKIGMLAGMERERAENVNQLLASAADFDPTGEGGLETTRDFVESVALTGAADAGSESDDAPPVYLITAHAAKGREFDNVYVVGVEDGIYPHSKAEGEVALQEERRLLFVATSRARTRLTISWCNRRNRFGHYEDAEPSPFLEGLEEHTTPIEVSSTRRNTGDWTRGERLASRPKFQGPRLSPIGPRAVAAEVDPGLFSPGMKVLHPTFGLGVVKDVQGTNIRIRFGETLRTLALAYARLTPVEAD